MAMMPRPKLRVFALRCLICTVMTIGAAMACAWWSVGPRRGINIGLPPLTICRTEHLGRSVIELQQSEGDIADPIHRINALDLEPSITATYPISVWPKILGVPPTSPSGASAWCSLVAGWPLPCLGVQSIVGPDGVERIIGGWRAGPAGNGPLFNSRGLVPLRIFWTGLVVNVALLMSAWYGLALGVAGVRRLVRRPAHACRRCRYDLRGLPEGAPCPECGAAR